MRKRYSNKKNQFDLEMNSLLDILIIIVFFLIISYSASNIEVDVVSNVQIPDSDSIESPINFLSVKIDKDKNIWVDNTKIANDFDPDENYIISLYDELAKKRATFNMVSKGAGLEEKNEVINLIVDKNIEYELIKNVMNTAYRIGVTQFKFIVLGKE